MKRLRCAVVGVGYLGKFHAEKYARLDEVELVGISDLNEEVGSRKAQELNCTYYQDYRDLFDKCDLVSIVVPAYKHHEIGCAFLKAGINCLIEKPFAITLAEAKEMKQLAATNSLMLSVGHLERFNPVFQRVKALCTSPIYLVTERLAEPQKRSFELDVVLDLMIHDLDLVLQLVPHPVRQIHCTGGQIFSNYTDAAQAYIIFENDAVASIAVSKISHAKSRRIRTFQPGQYISADLQNPTYTVTRQLATGGVKREQHSLLPTEMDTLALEIRNCVEAVMHSKEPFVTVDSALRTLEIALQINHQLSRQQSS